MQPEIEGLAHSLGEWLKGTGPENDVVVSSRVRLARNLVQFPFLSKATDEQKGEIEALVRAKLDSAGFAGKLIYVPVAELDTIDRQFLVERHIISKELAESEGNRGVAVQLDESMSAMVNEEDHLRLQAIRSGLELMEAWRAADALDDELAAQLVYAFNPNLGYLTACPTNVGTGLRASVMLHLPALVMNRKIEQVFNMIQKINLAVRGLHGEGSQGMGDFFQVSNQITLGKPEDEIIETIGDVVSQIVRFERQAREELLSSSRPALEDRVWRAYGLLCNARAISLQEAFAGLSAVKMGVALEMLDSPRPTVLNEMFLIIQPAHLQKHTGDVLERDQRRIVRADYIRRRLSNN